MYLLDEGATLPDEGLKLAEVEETFEWGGFHTVELTDEQSFTLDEGERFSVVVTQKCLDDGSYHASYDSGWSEASLEVLEQQYREQYYDERYQTYLEAATDALWVQARDEAFQAGKTEAEAIDAANAYVETEEARASAAETAASKAEAAIRDMVPTFYCEGVVNEGESFIYELDEEGEFFAWTDFYETSKAQEAQGVEVDNLPIKAYGYEVEEGDEYASAEALKQLEDAVKDARNDLAQTVVSADGTDVAKGAPWVTRAVHDAFEAAIAAAEAAVGAERPLAGDIERAAADLAAAREAFDAAKADGLKGGRRFGQWLGRRHPEEARCRIRCEGRRLNVAETGQHRRCACVGAARARRARFGGGGDACRGGAASSRGAQGVSRRRGAGYARRKWRAWRGARADNGGYLCKVKSGRAPLDGAWVGFSCRRRSRSGLRVRRLRPLRRSRKSERPRPPQRWGRGRRIGFCPLLRLVSRLRARTSSIGRRTRPRQTCVRQMFCPPRSICATRGSSRR